MLAPVPVPAPAPTAEATAPTAAAATDHEWARISPGRAGESGQGRFFLKWLFHHFPFLPAPTPAQIKV